MFESFIGINFWTALFVLLNTIVLFLVLKHFLFVPVMNMIKSRQEEIDNMYMEADNAKQGALALEAEYKEKLSQAAATGERMVKEAMERGHSRASSGVLYDMVRPAPRFFPVRLYWIDLLYFPESRRNLSNAATKPERTARSGLPPYSNQEEL